MRAGCAGRTNKESGAGQAQRQAQWVSRELPRSTTWLSGAGASRGATEQSRCHWLQGTKGEDRDPRAAAGLGRGPR